MNNIDFFNRFALAVLEELYSTFPTPTDVDVTGIATSVIPEDATPDATWNMLQASEDTIRFLSDEGFLTHKGEYLEGGTFLKARLTLKGMAVLGSTPEALSGGKSLIEQIKGALSSGGRTASSEVIKGLVQKALATALTYGSAAVSGTLAK